MAKPQPIRIKTISHFHPFSGTNIIKNIEQEYHLKTDQSSHCDRPSGFLLF